MLIRLVPVLLVMCVGAAPGLHAQTAMGVRVGMNRTALAGAQDSDQLTGMAASAYFGIGLGDRLALQIELGYGERGGGGLMVGENRIDLEDGTESEIRLRYVELPALLRAGYAGERFLPSIFVGPYAMFLTSCELGAAGGASGACDDQSRDAWFPPRSTDWGLVAGGALDYAIGEGTVFIDARYALGLRSIKRGANGMDLTNTGFTVSAGFAVPLSR